MSPYLRRLMDRLARIEKRLVEQDQRLARTILRGKVSEVRKAGGDWQVRLELASGDADGEAVKSPWVPVQPASAGALKIKVRPTEGEGMTLLSPSGVVGTASWAIRSPFDEDHPAPEGDEDVVIERGKTRLSIEDGKFVVTTGGGRIEVAGDEVKVNGKTAFTGEQLSHNGTNVGETHRHRDVVTGSELTGKPEGASA
ncbi:hypothetical protein [Xanthobacter autotrophicus]|uniref:hypothetical protein n=1 Tax=Xanthobacter autotrophicus TaxID=280 RepID=UPI003728BB1B